MFCVLGAASSICKTDFVCCGSQCKVKSQLWWFEYVPKVHALEIYMVMGFGSGAIGMCYDLDVVSAQSSCVNARMLRGKVMDFDSCNLISLS